MVQAEQTGSFLVLSGPGTVDRAREFRDALAVALATSPRLRLDFAGLSEAHVSLLQLVCATHRAALAAGKTVAWADPGPAVEILADEAGFSRGQGCGAGCLWSREPLPGSGC